MKKRKMSGCLLLTALFSMSVFAADSGVLSFDLSGQDEKDPTFHCDITHNRGTLWHPTKVTFTTDAALNFSQKGKTMENIWQSVVISEYFYVTKDQGGEGHVTYKTNNGSDIECIKGHGENRWKFIEE